MKHTKNIVFNFRGMELFPYNLNGQKPNELKNIKDIISFDNGIRSGKYPLIPVFKNDVKIGYELKEPIFGIYKLIKKG